MQSERAQHIDRLLAELPKTARNPQYQDALQRHLANFDHPPAPEEMPFAERMRYHFSTPRAQEAARIAGGKAYPHPRTVGYIEVPQSQDIHLKKPIEFCIRKIPHHELYCALPIWNEQPPEQLIAFGNGVYEDYPVIAIQITLDHILEHWSMLKARNEHPELMPNGGENISAYNFLRRYFTA
jgi:hypothetical protein